MSPYRRNLLVGLSVSGAIVILGWMILRFGDRPARLFTSPTMPIHFQADRADGLGDGSAITYRGVKVGHVSSVALTPDNVHVAIDGFVDVTPPLPGNLEGEIRSTGLIGGAAQLVLSPTGARSQGILAPNTTLPAKFVGLEVLPPAFAQLAEELQITAKHFNETNIVGNLNEQVNKIGRILDSIDKIASDEKLHEDVRVALDNIRAASESANRVGKQFEVATTQMSDTLTDVRSAANNTSKNIESLSKQMGDRLTQIAKALDHLDSITEKIDSGKGTAGQLVNDPKLYQSLVDTARELNATVSDFKRLAEQWEQEGVSLKVK